MPIKETRIENIPIGKIHISKGTVRKRQIEVNLDYLIKSIKRYGLLNPLIVSQKNDYELIEDVFKTILVDSLRKLAKKDFGE